MTEIKFCRRDENGWRVPVADSIAGQIYDLTRVGWSPSDIAALISGAGHKITQARVSRVIWAFKNPEAANASVQKYRRHPPMIITVSFFVLMHAAGLVIAIAI